MKTSSYQELITTINKNFKVLLPIFILYLIIFLIFILLIIMPKPIGRLSSKLFNVIYSTFSSSRSVLSTDVSSGNPEKSEKSEKSERSEKPEKSDKSEKGKLSSVMTPATSTPPAAAAAETTTTTTVSEFPDEKTAKLLQVVPSQSDLISFDELENPDQDPCLNCLDPCNSHSNYPNYLKKKIDYDSPLYNTVKPYIRHVLISTGKGDWETNIEDESDTLASNLHKVKNSIKKDVQKNNDHENTDHSRVIITNSSRINSDNNPSGSDVLIFPDNILIKNVTTNQVTDFYTRFLLPGEGNVINDDNFIIEKMPYRAIIVICSHKRRDKRCGITGPLLKDEFDKILKEKGLDPETRENDGVGVFLSSHTGGHRFAGNVIVYKEGKGIWYGRVVPCHAKSIIEHTIIEGKVIKDLYRGSMNGSFSTDCGGRNFDW